MKKLTMSVAAMAMISSAAMADDFDNTSVAIAAEGPVFGVELNTNETDRSVKLYSTDTPVDLGIKLTDNGTNQDYTLSIGKTVELPVGQATVYASPEATYTFGDITTTDELTITPALGVKGSANGVTPFAEVGLSYTSLKGDLLDFNRGNTYSKVGATVPVTANTGLTVDVTRAMDSSWKNEEHQLGVKLVVKF